MRQIVGICARRLATKSRLGDALSRIREACLRRLQRLFTTPFTIWRPRRRPLQSNVVRPLAAASAARLNARAITSGSRIFLHKAPYAFERLTDLVLRRAVGAADEALAAFAERAAGHRRHLLLEEQLLGELL